MATVDRNWASEAAAIVSGQSHILPEKQHLVVLAKETQSALAQCALLVSIIGACMWDTGQREIVLPQALLDHISTGAFGFSFEKVERDGVRYQTVTLTQRPMPGKARVN